jgi:hypothetical protein
MFGGVAKILWRGTNKADRAKLPGVGILPKPSPGNERHKRRKCNPISTCDGKRLHVESRASAGNVFPRVQVAA